MTAPWEPPDDGDSWKPYDDEGDGWKRKGKRGWPYEDQAGPEYWLNYRELEDEEEDGA